MFGRGRYGSTPHPKICRLEFYLQEREKPFDLRENDPLEWVRQRLRDSRRKYVDLSEKVYEEKRRSRPIKPVYF